MQHSNPSLHPATPAVPLSLEEALARAYERAVKRLRSGDLGLGHLFAAFTGRCDEHPGETTHPDDPTRPDAVSQPGDPDASADHDDPDAGTLVTLDELLPVFREPVEWALARAEQHADGDPVSLAALVRVRYAYQSRLTWIVSGGTLGEARPRFRPADVLTVIGLVAGSIDPSFADRASSGIRDGVLEALARVIPIGMASDPSVAGALYPAPPHRYGLPFPGASASFCVPTVPYPDCRMCHCRHCHIH